MKWLAFATDFDGTIATDAVVDEPTQLALVRLRSANVRTLLVTGRHLSDFEAMGSFIAIFDMVVAENGAVLFEPASGEIRTCLLRPPRRSQRNFPVAESIRWGLDARLSTHASRIKPLSLR